MRNLKEIEDRVRALLFSELMRRLSIPRLPQHCRFNQRHSLDYRKTVEGGPNPSYNRITAAGGLPVVQEIGLCMYGSEDSETWPGDLCDEPVDAQRCGKFEPVQSLKKEEVFAEFRRNVNDADWLKKHLPEVHELLWVLGQIVAPYVDQMPWWKRVWFLFFAKVDIHPPMKVQEDPIKLLEGYGADQLKQLAERSHDS